MLVHPIADRHHRRFGSRDDAPLNQQPPDRDIGLSVLPVIADPRGAAIPQPDPTRALDLKKKRVDRIVDPKELKAAPGERAILDLSSGIARGRSGLSGPPIDWRLIAPSLPPRSVQLNLVISGKQPFARAVIGDRKRGEGRLEEAACRDGVLWRQCGSGLTRLSPGSHWSVVRDPGPCVERGCIRQRQKPVACFEKSRDRRRKRTIRPPLQLGEFYR